MVWNIGFFSHSGPRNVVGNPQLWIFMDFQALWVFQLMGKCPWSVSWLMLCLKGALVVHLYGMEDLITYVLYIILFPCFMMSIGSPFVPSFLFIYFLRSWQSRQIQYVSKYTFYSVYCKAEWPSNTNRTVVGKFS